MTRGSYLRWKCNGRDLVGDGRHWGIITNPRVNGFQVDSEILFLAGLVVAEPKMKPLNLGLDS